MCIRDSNYTGGRYRTIGIRAGSRFNSFAAQTADKGMKKEIDVYKRQSYRYGHAGNGQLPTSDVPNRQPATVREANLPSGPGFT